MGAIVPCARRWVQGKCIVHGDLGSTAPATQAAPAVSSTEDGAMRAAIIDPRDATQLEEDPAYRVEFWASPTHAEEWRLVEAGSVIEVIAWAEKGASGRDAVLYAEHRTADGVGLVRLMGRSPGWCG
jgi:hypothetical protein